MKLRTYHTGSVETAARLAAIELGDDAVFLGSRKADGAEGVYEVTFALPRGSEPDQAKRSGRGGELSAGPGSAADLGERAIATPVEAHSLQVERAHWKHFLPRPLDDKQSGDAKTAGFTGPESTSRPQPSALPWERDNSPEASGGADSARGQASSSSTSPSAGRSASPAEHAVPPARTAAASAGTAPAMKTAADPAEAARLEQQLAAWEDHRRERDLRESMDALGRSMESLTRTLEGSVAAQSPALPPAPDISGDPVAGMLHRVLRANEVAPQLAAQIVGGAGAGPEPKGQQKPDEAWEAAAGRLAALLAIDDGLGRPGERVKVTALVGPPGAGKTAAIIKLAVGQGLGRGWRVALLSLGGDRIGGDAALGAHAELLGIPLTTLEDAGQLVPALDRMEALAPGERPDLVLIDTPGYDDNDWPAARRLAAVLQARRLADVHLVLSLASKPADLRRAVERFSIFAPDKLLFARLDETATYGSVLNEAARTGLPVSFLSTGRRIPEDLTPATHAYLAELLLRKSLLL